MIKEDVFTVKWQVEDGYVSGSRPQSFKLGRSDIEDDMNDDQLAVVLEEAVRDAFEQKADWSILNYAAAVEWMKAVRDEKAKEGGE